MKYCYHCMSPKDGAVCATCNKADPESVPAHRLQPGTILNGRFMIGTALGEGGCGITYIGRDTNLDIKVAIKEFYPNGFANRNNTVSMEVTHNTEEKKNFFEKGRKDFLKEARILAKFSGEAGIVDVRDHFEANNTAYIVMEYLEGTDLRGYLRQKGKLSPEETIDLLLPVIRSLEKIHKDGLIHRDISPDNIRIVGGMVKLIDFGAARDIASVTNKNSLSVMLKPGYAPMEQYSRKGKQGSWTDVYGLCATIYKCITGITPEDATDRIQADELKKPSELGCNITPTFEKALLKGLSISVENRIKTVSELMDAIDGKTEISDFNADDKTIFIPEDEKTIIETENSKTISTYAVTSVPYVHDTPNNKKNSKKTLLTIVAIIVFLILTASVLPFIFSEQDTISNKPKTTEPISENDTVLNIYVPDEILSETNVPIATTQPATQQATQPATQPATQQATTVSVSSATTTATTPVTVAEPVNTTATPVITTTKPVTTSAAPITTTIQKVTVIDSGSCGTNILWQLDDAGLLNISGSGTMSNYTDDTPAPWYDYNEAITEVTLSSGITSIGDYAFYNCEAIRSVAIPSGIISIGAFAFNGCDALASVSLPSSLNSIDELAFGGCDILKNITIPANVSTLGEFVFYKCFALQSITVEAANANYSSKDGVLYNQSQTVLICYPADKADKEFEIPASVNTIEDFAFISCNNLHELTFNSNTHITEIGANSFMSCISLQKVKLPETVTFIGESAFNGCLNMNTIYLPTSLKTIDINAFMGCTSLNTVEYSGSSYQWQNISIGTNNDNLINAFNR